MDRFRVVLVDHEWDSLAIEQKMFLQQTETPIEFLYIPSRTEEELITATADADAVLVLYAKMNRQVITQMKRCKIISRYGVGVDMIDVEAATEKGIYVANVPDYGIDEVSDHVLAFILAQSRRLFAYHSHVAQGGWDFKSVDIPVRASKTRVGLIGFGNIARRLAKKLLSIGYQVCSYDPYVPDQTMRASGVASVSLEELLQTSDYISIHVPLVKETRHLISFSEFAIMKRSAFLINAARGPIVDENALLDALNKKQIAGAALDVTETEPLPEHHPLRRMPNVVITPHAAWYSEDALVEIRRKACQNIIDFMKMGKPTYLVNSHLAMMQGNDKN
ncbi:MAG: C-terminal binding protein [Thermoanaerobacteraceae bacterium]|nr:C-terminal binding protein [Thermoanaerobacteraceae bacterium]